MPKGILSGKSTTVSVQRQRHKVATRWIVLSEASWEYDLHRDQLYIIPITSNCVLASMFVFKPASLLISATA